jgi:KRAB domain-containing zinc finger protein
MASAAAISTADKMIISNFLQHFLVLNEKPFSCNTCGKGFARKTYLTRHQICHKTEKPFLCDQCGKWFARKSYLIIHQRCHNGEKPIYCDICGKNFKYASGLSYHRHHAKNNLVCYF